MKLTFNLSFQELGVLREIIGRFFILCTKYMLCGHFTNSKLKLGLLVLFAWWNLFCQIVQQFINLLVEISRAYTIQCSLSFGPSVSSSGYRISSEAIYCNEFIMIPDCILKNTYYSRDLIFARPSPMVYSRDFIFAICHIFFFNPHIRNYWRGLYFRVSTLSRIYLKIRSSRIKSDLQFPTA